MPPAGGCLRTSLPPSVRLVEDPDTLPSLHVATRAARAHVYFHGAHVTHWRPAHAAAPVLWLSARSHFREDKAIRGGVPICFPWFGPHPSEHSAPAHGLARLADWTLVDALESPDGTVMLAFVLDTGGLSTPLWPHRCRITFRVSIGTTLLMTLDVENRGGLPLVLEEALHTYLAVQDIREVSINGLEGTDYLDKVEGFARKRDSSEPIRFHGETDRVYLDTAETCAIVDPGCSRTISIRKSGSLSTVVWNPWEHKAASFTDFGADEWQQMVCVETANVGAAAIHLPPSTSHSMTAEISSWSR